MGRETTGRCIRIGTRLEKGGRTSEALEGTLSASCLSFVMSARAT